MRDVGAAIRTHHEELIAVLSAEVEALAEGRPDADLRVLAKFLHEEVLPHATGEEQHLYAFLESLYPDAGRFTATMRVDHEYIANYIHRIDELVEELERAPSDVRPALRRRLTHLALQLQALLEVHMQKEERVYLPLLEEHATQEQQQEVLDGMRAAHVQK